MWFCSGLTLHGSLGPTRGPGLDCNFGAMSEALGRLAAGDWLHGIVPWWDSYTGIGLPLAGELQPGAFFLPFNLLLLLPEGILWQKISMQIIAALATYALLRELDLTRLAALTGAALFAVNGTIAWTPGPAAVYCSLPFLPLLLWGIEHARKQQRGATSILAIGVAIAWSILAGFPEPAYISGLLVLAWGLYRLASEPKRWTIAWRAMAGCALGILVATPLLIAFLDYVRQSDSFGIHNYGEKSLPWAAFSTTLMPYVYGPLGLTFHSPALARVWGVGGYTGILIILIAVVGLTSSAAHRGLKLLLLAWILLVWAKTFGVQPVMALMNFVPLLKKAMFYRYAAPSWELALIILAAFGLDDFRDNNSGWRRAFGIAICLLLIGTALAWPLRAFWERPQTFVPIMFLPLGLSLTWALAGLLAAGLSSKLLRGEQRRVTLTCLLVFDAVVMFLVAQSSGIRDAQIDTRAMQFLADHQGLSRTYTLGPIRPNYGAYFRVATIDHSALPVPRLWVDYVEHNLLPGFKRIDTGTTFWPGFMLDREVQQALSQNLANYRNLGVRYVVTNPSQSPMPTTFLPATDTNTDSLGPKGQSFVSILGMLSPVLQRCQSVAVAQAKPTIECFMVRTVLKMSPSMVRPLGQEGTSKDGGSVESLNTESMVLQSGQSAKISMTAPPPVPDGSPITSVGAVVGNSGGAIDGYLTVEICAGTICRSGQRLLAGSNNNEVFQIPLDKPLAAYAGAPLRLTLAHLNGSRPVALRLVSSVAEMGQQIQGPNGTLAGQTLQLAFEYGMPLLGLRKVYADSVMDIWELPDPAPYFQVIQGGPCILSTARREDVTAECAAPATLLRRELYMSGWGVTVNEAASVAVQQAGIFQSAALPLGRSQVRYHFAPPYIELGWAASIVGMAGLIWQVILIGRPRQQQLQEC